MPRRDRRRRADDATTSTGCRPIPGPMATPPGFSRRRRVRRDRRAAARTSTGTTAGSRRRASSARSSRRAWRSRRGLVRPRAVLPLGVGGLRAGRPGPFRGHAGRAAAAAFKASGFMEWTPAVLGAVGRDLDRACSRRRTSTSTARRRSSSAWIALNARRNAELNPKAIYRDADDDRRLHGVAHHHDAVLACSTATCRATARPR